MSLKTWLYTAAAPIATGYVEHAVDHITVSGLTGAVLIAAALNADKTRVKAFALAAGLTSATALLAVDYKQSLDRKADHAHVIEMTLPRVG